MPMCFGIPGRGSHSEVYVDAANAYGSGTSSTVERFLNVITNKGTAIQYVDDPINGALFLIKEDGIYSMTYCYASGNAAAAAGIVKNVALGSGLAVTSTTFVGTDKRIAISVCSGTNNSTSISACSFLRAGDVINPSTDTTALSGTTGNRDSFRITKVSA